MDVPLILAGSLALLAAAIHGGVGEVFVVRELSPERLPPTRFGGPRLTKVMIHASWHLATVAFLAVGVALLLSGAVLDGDAGRAMGLFAAGAATGFAAVVVGLGAAGPASPRVLIRHAGPPPAHRHRGAGLVGSALTRARPGLPAPRPR